MAEPFTLGAAASAAGGTAASSVSLLSAASLGLTAFSTYQSIQAGRAQEQAAKFKATQERTQAIQRENAQRRQLIQTLSANQAAFGARGVSTASGSPFALQQRNVEQGRQDLLNIQSTAQLREAQTRQAGSEAFKQGLTKAVTTGGRSLIDELR